MRTDTLLLVGVGVAAIYLFTQKGKSPALPVHYPGTPGVNPYVTPTSNVASQLPGLLLPILTKVLPTIIKPSTPAYNPAVPGEVQNITSDIAPYVPPVDYSQPNYSTDNSSSPYGYDMTDEYFG